MHFVFIAVSDNDTKLKKSNREMGYTHICDVSHSIASMVEQADAKTGRCKRFIKSLSAVKIREVMRPAGYLLFPVQHSIARFNAEFLPTEPLREWKTEISGI